MKPDVQEEILTGHSSSGGVLCDVCDGSFVQSHVMFKEDPETILLSMYYDELEIVNPLGSKRGKHKLGIVYNIVH